MPTAHHQHGPSKLNYYASCPLFQNAQREINDAAEEGTFLHEVMEKIVKLVVAAPDEITCLNAFATLRNEWSLTDEQTGYVMWCCRELDVLIEEWQPDHIAIEEKVTLRRLDGSEIHWGTLDIAMICEHSEIVVVVDFKFGWLPVPAASVNLQGKSYAAAAVRELLPEVKRAEIVFLQPKLGVVSKHLADLEELDKATHCIEQLLVTVESSQADPDHVDPALMMPGSHCQWCSRIGTCTAHARMMSALSTTHLPAPVQLPVFDKSAIKTTQQLAAARYIVDVWEDAVDAIKAATNEAVKAGDDVSVVLPDGTKIQYAKFTRKLDRSLGDTVEVANCLSEYMSMDDILSCATLSITSLLPAAAKNFKKLCEARGEKMTMKEATKIITDLLSTRGLLSQPDGMIVFAKLKKTSTKEVTYGTQENSGSPSGPAETPATSNPNAAPADSLALVPTDH